MRKAKNTLHSIIRFINSLRRPSKKTNRRKLKERGETLDSYKIREATATDIPALSELHVKTWNDTYGVKNLSRGPSYKTREYQWRKAFEEENDDSWFCLLVEDPHGKLVGFAKGKKHKQENPPGHSGEVNKIYLLDEYQRIGIGRKLLGHVVHRFLNEGINTMTLFGIPQNPSCAFHEAMGGKRLYDEKGEFFGGYQWTDLQKLSSICPV